MKSQAISKVDVSLAIVDSTLGVILGREVSKIQLETDPIEQSSQKREITVYLETMIKASESIASALRNAIRKISEIRDIPEEEKLKYIEGFRTGLGWRDDYRPGGPFVFKDSPQSKFNHEAWLKGFDKGIEARDPLLETVKQEIGL